MRFNSFTKRLQGAETRASKAVSLFESAARELELVAQDQRELHDALSDHINDLDELRQRAKATGTEAQARAEKIRNLFA